MDNKRNFLQENVIDYMIKWFETFTFEVFEQFFIMIQIRILPNSIHIFE